MNYLDSAKKLNRQGYYNSEVLFKNGQIENIRKVFEESFLKKNFPKKLVYLILKTSK